MRTTKTTATIFLFLSLLVANAALADTESTAGSTAAGSSTVEFAADDGIVLKATYTSPGKPGPGVLLLHMCNSDRTAWTSLAGKLANRGIHSLALDYRGYGDSGGEQSAEARQKWAGDVDAALAFLRSRPGVDTARIGAAGGSCGVNQAVQAARRHPGEVQVLALLAGGTDGAGTAFLAENPWIPVLGVASHDDGQAVDILRWTLGFSGHSANRFLEYEQGGHGTELFAVHDDLEPAIGDWFAEHLVDQPVERPAELVAQPGPSTRLWNELMAPGGLDRMAARLQAGESVDLPPEGALNAEGYRQIAAGKSNRAIEVFQFVVEAFPTSANALDSLGDAYLADGRTDKAAELARQAIAAIPKDPNLSENFAQAIRESAEGKLKAAQASEGQ